MDYTALHRKKLTTADEAVKVVKSGDWVDYSFCANIPVALDQALAKRLEEEPELKDLQFRSGIALRYPEVTKIPDAAERITWNSCHSSGLERKLVDRGFGFYTPIRYSELPRYYRETLPVNIAMFQVAPMDKHGNFNFGLSPSHQGATCEKADVIIVEVNRKMPVCLGGAHVNIHIDKVDMVVEGDNPPIGQLPAAAPTIEDMAVAKLILPLIPNGACIQLGIGGMPNAVGVLIAQSDLKDLGVHSEMYVDAFVDMVYAGKVTGAKKQLDTGRQVFTFAAGTQKLYDYIDNNPAVMGAPVEYVNDVRIISALDNFISINNTVNVDLYGQVASESAGIRHISGSGGQQDFVLGAYLSKGGKSFICCSSTVKGSDGKLKSRILPTLEPGSVVTATRPNVHYLVTEYGVANMKGLTAWQRAEAIISLAHPDFREELITEAGKMGIWHRSNKVCIPWNVASTASK